MQGRLAHPRPLVFRQRSGHHVAYRRQAHPIRRTEAAGCARCSDRPCAADDTGRLARGKLQAFPLLSLGSGQHRAPSKPIPAGVSDHHTCVGAAHLGHLKVLLRCVGWTINVETPTILTCGGALCMKAPLHLRRIENCVRVMHPQQVESPTD